jgi:small subunit ribosomal protein S1
MGPLRGPPASLETDAHLMPPATETNKAGSAPADINPASISTEEFAKLFSQHLDQNKVKEQSIVHGRVVAVGKDYVIVDVAHKMEGLIDVDEFRSEEGELSVTENDSVEVWIELLEDRDGNILLSKAKADLMKAWERLETAYEAKETVEGVIIGRVKGGLQVDIGVKSFLPGSQVDLRPVKNLDKLVGTKASFRIIKFNKRRGNIVLSRRVLLEEELDERRDELKAKLRVGAVVEGTVKNITEYGAFVDLGGIDGLLHVTDMSWGRINHPSELFQVGDQIACRILKFDPDTNKVSLGFKQIREDPWLDAAERYPVGSVVEGKVVSLPDYGAFVELEEGIEGLVHISEMTWDKRVKHPSKMLEIKQTVQAVVLDIDPASKRVSLGMKQLMPNPWDAIDEKFPEGSIVEGPVRNITDFGIFVGVDEGIDGLVHISDISWSQRVKHPSDRYKKGDVVRARVMSIDRDGERLSLSIKDLQTDPWEGIEGRFYVGMSVEGKIVSVAEFGVFVELEEGIEGLVHKSELAVFDHQGSYKVGEAMRAEVLSIDPYERKIGLTEVTEADAAAGPAPAAQVPVESQLGDLMGSELAQQLSDLAGREEGAAAADEAKSDAAAPSEDAADAEDEAPSEDAAPAEDGSADASASAEAEPQPEASAESDVEAENEAAAEPEAEGDATPEDDGAAEAEPEGDADASSEDDGEAEAEPEGDETSEDEAEAEKSD